MIWPACTRRNGHGAGRSLGGFLRGLAFLWLVFGAALAVPPPSVQPQLASPAPEAGLPFVRNFSPKEYGARTQNWAIVQDPRGVIYVGNGDGVLEFDGTRWRLIQVGNRTTVFSLAVDDVGRVYVGAQGELGYLEPDTMGRMRYVSLLDRIPPEERGFTDVWKTYATKEGVVFATYTRIFRVGARVECWKPRTSFHKLFHVNDRLFVLEVGRGLLELKGEAWGLVPGGQVFANEKIYAMLPRPGTAAILIGTHAQGLFLFDGKSITPFPTEADAAIKRDLLYAAVNLTDGSLALGTLQAGVYLLDAQGHLRGRLDKTGSLTDDTVRALFQDAQGGLWVGLDKGIARAEVGFPLTFFSGPNGLDCGILSLHRSAGTLYAGTTKGLSRLEFAGEGLWRFRPVPGIKTQTWGFLDWQSNFLVASSSGVFEVAGGVPRLVRPSRQVSETLIRSERVPSRVFVGLWNGLASMRFEKGAWVDEGNIPGITDTIRTIFEAGDGRLWLGTNTSGVLRLSFPPGWKGGTDVLLLERFGIAEGLPSLNDNRIYRLGNEPLFATHQGLYHFDGKAGRFAPDPRFQGLFPDRPRWLMGLQADPQGRLWMHTVDEARGLREAGAAVPLPGDGGYRWQPTPPLPLTATDNVLSTLADPSGVVWFGSPADGLFRYDSRVPRKHRHPFRALVRRVVARGDQMLFGGTSQVLAPTLPYADNALRFEFAATSFDGPEANRFQVLLDGVDRDWSPWSTEAYRDYTNLREGPYRFRVRAQNLHGTLSEEGTYGFRIQPPWYRTWWAYLSFLVSGPGMMVLLFQARTRILRRRNLELQLRVTAATSELSKREQEALAHSRNLAKANVQLAEANEQKNLFFGIVAHDLRNPLNGIVLAAELLDGEEDINEVWATARKINQEGREMSNLIGRFLEIAAIESGSLQAEPSLFEVMPHALHVIDRHKSHAKSKGIELVLEAEPDDGAVFADLKFTKEILDNLISNAIKFSPPGGRVRVSGKDLGGKYLISIEDQGPGFTAEDRQRLFGRFARLSAKPTGGEKSTGLGLSIVKHMVEAMGGRIWVDSEPGNGATFRLELPTSQNAQVS